MKQMRNLNEKNISPFTKGIKNKDVDKHIEWQRNVIRSEYVDEKSTLQTEKEIQGKRRGSVE